jgi:cytoskeleton protein RodZ
LTDVTSLGVGRALSEARQAQGLALADVAQQLKFMTRQLEALEAERFESLPGPTIARGMVRTYARFLKLDPEPLLACMSGHVDTRDATPQLAARFSQPVPFSDGGKRSTVVYLGLSVVVLALVGTMAYEWRQERKAPEVVAAATPAAKERAPRVEKTAPPIPQPDAQAEATPAPVAPPREATAPSAAPAAPSAKPAPAAPPPSAKTASPAPSAKTAPAAPQAPATLAAKAAGEPKSTGPNRLVLRFEEAAWAEVTDGLGRQLVSSLNPAGTERVVRGRPPLNLVIGNAQHVKVTFNDREIDLQPHVKVEVARFTIK